MTITQTKPQFLTEALIEVLNNEWKVNGIESGRSVYTQLEIEEGRKYIKVWSYLMTGGERTSGRSCCCLLYTSPSPRDQRGSRMPSSA